MLFKKDIAEYGSVEGEDEEDCEGNIHSVSSRATLEMSYGVVSG